ncbi:helix-turn-helix domain-containing protein [Companilactobacillus mishanensis]|uniref:Helix-turn-helix domain-containing protein n=1 Tax=Companilactobacillus mishanensis TaxID=2486008 RepID=A0A5P0ZKS1_9LACO|nr:helix-turn-helix domain-containing protein [Companilactobacillus mishanensis]MQS53642.1 helix-turn-helix domain-containing protein [Companilactobacillus mishanensis]
MSRSKYSLEDKLNFITQFQNSTMKRATFARIHGISRSTLNRWLVFYEQDGIQGLKDRTNSSTYSESFKLKIVKEYLCGESTLEGLVFKYKLRGNQQVHEWIFKYNNGKSLARRHSPRKKKTIMGRKTSFEERIKIVEYVVKNNYSYTEAADHFSVSYQQVRSWVMKSKNGGYEALQDNRGHRKAKEDLTDLDKANLKIRQLESQLKDQKTIEEFAKKLQELQRRG